MEIDVAEELDSPGESLVCLIPFSLILAQQFMQECISNMIIDPTASSESVVDVSQPVGESVEMEALDLDQPLAVRRTARKRRIPHRFGKNSDLLPSAQLAAMRIYSEMVTPEPSPIPTPQPSPSSSRSTSPVPVNRRDPESTDRETVPNQFGLYRRFTEWPSVDPEDDITINHLTDAPTFTESIEYGHRNEDTSGPVASSSNPFSPYLNATVYRLMNWFYQTGVKSLADMDALVHDVLRVPDFDATHLEGFSASREAKRLDDDPIHPMSDGWQESTVNIRLPKTYSQFRSEKDAPEAKIPGVLHRDLLQSIVSAFREKSMEAFNLKGFTQLWKPSTDETAEEVFGEAYASAAFREMEEEIRSDKPPGETIESIVVPLMVYSIQRILQHLERRPFGQFISSSDLRQNTFAPSRRPLLHITWHISLL